MREMVKRGHEVVTIADQTPESYEYEGVKVLSIPQGGDKFEKIKEYAKDADILITHLDCTSHAMTLSLAIEKPLVHFVHNCRQLGPYPGHRVNPLKAQLVIFNSDWIAKKQQWEMSPGKSVPWPGPSITIHPIVEPEKYKCERGNKITLCNPTTGKGAHTVHKLAEQMPDYKFLVVAGIYGEQIAPPHLGDEWVKAHPNIEHIENKPDFRDVLRQTKVLLMPSDYESYGRCAVEAACAGIPSIVHPTEGLLESLRAERIPSDEDLQGGWVSGAGIFCDREDIESWKSQLERLFTDEVYYRSRSDAALRLANSLDPESEFDRLEDALLLTHANWLRRNEVIEMKMWTPDSRLWETSDGTIVREVGGRIPQNAIRSLGLEPIPEEAAIRNGLIPDPHPEMKMAEPSEDKAIHEPAENKARKTRKKKDKAA
jgi:glycosyltransferase involved in cell wall biosynthesis